MKHVKTIFAPLQKHASIFIIAAAICMTIKASAQQKLKAFEGYYQFVNDENTFLKITAKGDSLILKQLWDNREFSFHQTAALEFYCDVQLFPLKFKDSAGNIVQVLAFNKDVGIK